MISLVVVNYRSAELAAEAIRTARAATAEPIEVVVVDNSLERSEVDALWPYGDVVFASATNRGYAGGINDGRRAARGEVIIACNPDVTFAPGAIDRLAQALAGGAAVAGPALFWDAGHRWLLPPADLHAMGEKLDEVLAGRSARWAMQRDRRRFLRRLRFWSTRETHEVRALSGAVLAIRADAFDALGGFDERFALYFEETDFLRRAIERRMRVVHVPAARCRHLYNQSAGQQADAASARYAESELRYLEKWNGPFLARLWSAVAKPPLFDTAKSEATTIELDRDDLVVEASPLPSFATAAGHFPTSRRVELPPDVLRAWRGGPLYLRAVTRRGEVVNAIRMRL